MSTVEYGGGGPAGADPGGPRLADPELRSRVVGYLRRAPRTGTGLRGDGVWRWSEYLAERVRRTGGGLHPEFLEHCVRHGFLPPTVIAVQSPSPTDPAVAQPSCPDADGVRFYAAVVAGAQAPTDLLRRQDPAGEPVVWSWLGPNGWSTGAAPAAGVRLRELTSRDAAALADELCGRWHDQLAELSQESDVDGSAPRLARVFDRAGPDGAVWFSPNRLRLVDPAQRERIARYLCGGRMVLRASGRLPDPLSADVIPVVPLSFRTDGVWVWQEALAYYVRRRGIAPELALLCHIEEGAVSEPALVSDAAVQRAATVATGPTPPRPPVPATYLRGRAGELFRRRGDTGLVGPGLARRRPGAGWFDTASGPEAAGSRWLRSGVGARRGGARRRPALAQVSGRAAIDRRPGRDDRTRGGRELDERWCRLVGSAV